MSTTKRKSTRKPHILTAAILKSQVMLKIKSKDGFVKHNPTDYFQFRTSSYTPGKSEELEGLLEVPDSEVVMEIGMGIVGKGKQILYSIKKEVCVNSSGSRRKKKADSKFIISSLY